ncbi:hypothetical protein [Cetobacterium sp.]|uniref:hypothetical protein n=1 Tax=Cetobacterium sp. TaxID=2071632 RepID=UPI003EE63BC4
MKITFDQIILKKQSFERIDSVKSEDILVGANIGIKSNIAENISDISCDLIARNKSDVEIFKLSVTYFIAFKFDLDKAELEKIDQQEINKLIFEEAYKKEISKQIKAILINASFGSVQLPTFKKN